MTGAPGVGKTTLIRRLHEHYKNDGMRVAGVITREVRKGDRRVGFRITDLSSGSEGWLARREEGEGPRIGNYTVAKEDLDRIGVGALHEALETSVDLVLVDEIGPMEMTSSGFRAALTKILSQSTIMIATVKYGSHYPEVEKVSNEPGIMKIEVTRNNREKVFEVITSRVNGWIAQRN